MLSASLNTTFGTENDYLVHRMDFGCCKNHIAHYGLQEPFPRTRGNKCSEEVYPSGSQSVTDPGA